MPSLIASSRETLEDLILEALGRQECGEGKPQYAVRFCQIQTALGVREEAPLHAWANDFCRRRSLTVFLIGGDRMYFSPHERSTGDSVNVYSDSAFGRR